MRSLFIPEILQHPISPKDFEEYARQKNVRGLIIGSIVAALAFVVGLFWYEAIKSSIEFFVPRGDTITAKFVAASMVTVISVIVSYALFSGLNNFKNTTESTPKDK